MSEQINLDHVDVGIIVQTSEERPAPDPPPGPVEPEGGEEGLGNLQVDPED